MKIEDDVYLQDEIKAGEAEEIAENLIPDLVNQFGYNLTERICALDQIQIESTTAEGYTHREKPLVLAIEDSGVIYVPNTDTWIFTRHNNPYRIQMLLTQPTKNIFDNMMNNASGFEIRPTTKIEQNQMDQDELETGMSVRKFGSESINPYNIPDKKIGITRALIMSKLSRDREIAQLEIPNNDGRDASIITVREIQDSKGKSKIALFDETGKSIKLTDTQVRSLYKNMFPGKISPDSPSAIEALKSEGDKESTEFGATPITLDSVLPQGTNKSVYDQYIRPTLPSLEKAQLSPQITTKYGTEKFRPFIISKSFQVYAFETDHPSEKECFLLCKKVQNGYVITTVLADNSDEIEDFFEVKS